MPPALTVGLAWLLFGATHVGLASRPLRTRLVSRLGEARFSALFSVVALAAFSLLVTHYAAHRFAGAAGPALGAVPPLRAALIAVVVIGIVFQTAGLLAYARSPYAPYAHGAPPPTGVARITRHPFMVGFAMTAGAHVFLATLLVGSVFAAGFAVVAIGGAMHQDRKLAARRGRPYAEYVRATSLVPFAAVLAGRQRVVWRELPPAAVPIGLGVAYLLRGVHGAIFSDGGVWVIAAVGGGAALLGLQAWVAPRATGPAALGGRR